MEVPFQNYTSRAIRKHNKNKRNNNDMPQKTIGNEASTAQCVTDARLIAEYEESDSSSKLFDYSKFVPYAPNTTTSDDQINAYLTKIQRGGLVQSFGCMLVIKEPSFEIISYSENCGSLLGLSEPNLIGVDARTLFTTSSNASLAKIIVAKDLSLLNPIWVHSSHNNKSFYAILHRIDVGTVVDLEPAHSGDPATTHAGTVQSQKLAMRAISRMQLLPGGDIEVLCDSVVEDVQKLTGYDRVMAYKFHDDNHGEVISEIRRSDFEPYLGLHYPATDIPQAARFLFLQNRVRMICDVGAEPVKVIQSAEMKKPLCLLNSTLRSPHACHAEYMTNMGCISSLVMAIAVNNGGSMKLWGLVVCHHSSPRYVPFPLRYACEFLVQAFSMQLHMELQIASQLVERRILQTQTLLSEIILRDARLSGIMTTHSPNAMDLVKCDGAALYYGGKHWLLGVTPTESQLHGIIQWLLKKLGDSTGFSTDSLVDAGYPGGALLGPAVCGVAVARFSPSDFLMWFRSSEANEVKWGGAKHHPEDGKMHPRTSFNAFVETVKRRSKPWETAEIGAIHSLELILREFVETTTKKGGSDEAELNEITSVAAEMVRVIETATAPIFGVDSAGAINGWNTKMFELTGLGVSEAMGKSLLTDIVHKDSRDVVEILVARALQGKEDRNVEVKLLKFGVNTQNSVVYILVNTCTSRDFKKDVVGVCFVGQDLTNEKNVLHKFMQLEGSYNVIIQSANPLIPPIFAADESARCSEWNAVMENLTGWMRHETIGKMLPGEVFGSLCRLRGPDVLTKFVILLNRAISGHDTTAESLNFGFFNRKGEFVEVCLTANKKVNESGHVIGCVCFLRTMIPMDRDNKPVVIEEGIKTEQLSKQLTYIIKDGHVGSSDEGSKIELKVEEFLFGNLVNVIVSQAMILLREKNLHLIHDIPEQIKTLCVYGDRIKLQLALSDFLHSTVNYAPCLDGWIQIKVSLGLKLMQDGDEYVHLEIRMTHPGSGLPYPLIDDMFSVKNHWTTQEGMALNISQRLLSMMNGKVRYVREQNRCYFQIELELKSKMSG